MKRYSKIAVVLALVLMASTFAAADDVGFTGNYAPGAFTFNANGGSGSVNWSAPGSFTITGNNSGGSNIDTTVMTTAAYAATISFNWNYTSADPDTGFDFPFYVVINGINVLCCDNVAFGQNASGSGTISFSVNAGDTFGWGVRSTDGIFGAGALTISNFSSTAEVPEPATLFLLGSGLVGAAGTLRKRFAKA